jgi:hypothetical protein
MLVFSVALLSSTVSCGGGSVATVPVGTLAVSAVDPCAGFPSGSAVPGTIVAVSASDAASFPSATSCAEAAALRSGAIIVAKGVPEAQINALVGLDPGDVDAVGTGTTADASAPAVTSANQLLGAEAFALDGDGALQKLVVAGDPSQAQAAIDAWIAERATAATSRRPQSSGSGLAAAWTTMLTQKLVNQPNYVVGSSGLSRTVSIYRLNSPSLGTTYFLVANKIVTMPNPQPCSGSTCTTWVLSRNTYMLSNSDVFESGPDSSNAPMVGLTVGNGIEGGDAASGTYAISWPQVAVEEHSLAIPELGAQGAAWQEVFPNPSGFVAPLQLSFNSTNGFASYSAAIFTGPPFIGNVAPLQISFRLKVITIATFQGIANFPTVNADNFDSWFEIHPPQFALSSVQPALLHVTANNGNGGGLRWRLVSTPTQVNVAPISGGFTSDVQLSKKSPNGGPVTESLTFDTVPSLAGSQTHPLVWNVSFP